MRPSKSIICACVAPPGDANRQRKLSVQKVSGCPLGHVLTPRLDDHGERQISGRGLLQRGRELLVVERRPVYVDVHADQIHLGVGAGGGLAGSLGGRRGGVTDGLQGVRLLPQPRDDRLREFLRADFLLARRLP